MNPFASAGDGYSGLWQLNYNTAGFYGLNINSFLDERRDPELSTNAAVKYISDLHSIYNDWELCLAAYLCGATTINKAIRRAKGNASYSGIYSYLPPEYRDIVPAFSAVLFVVNQPKKLNLTTTPLIIPLTDTVWINRRVHFEQICKVLCIDEQLINEHNPMFKIRIVPGGKDTFILNLPPKLKTEFARCRDSIYNYQDSLYNQKSIQDAAAVGQIYTSRQTPVRSNFKSAASQHGITWYTVKAGESFYSISRKYEGVSAKDIMEANKIKNPQSLRVGQKIKIPRKP
jgi:membrane-bound lytic murein transglycosylase D